MTLALEVQIALDFPDLPSETELRRWAEATLAGADYQRDIELVIRIVSETESAILNETYRHKQGPTNVLAFPFEAPAGIAVKLLGDVVICAPLVVCEALSQGKAISAHWAHMVSHGILHLLGYGHQDEGQTEQMEALEVNILNGLGYPNPYGEVNKHK
jgi:probable rRNA maturation factor